MNKKTYHYYIVYMATNKNGNSGIECRGIRSSNKFSNYEDILKLTQSIEIADNLKDCVILN